MIQMHSEEHPIKTQQKNTLELEKFHLQNSMDIPLKYHSVLFSQLQGISDTIQYAKHMAREGHSIILTGSCGTGKTHLAVCLMRMIWAEKYNADRDKTPIYKSYPDLLAAIKQSWTGNPADEWTWINRLSNAPVLVLDDLGVGNHTDWSRGIVYQVIDKRYRDCKQTIITTNLSINKLSEVVDDRIASRLCDGIVIEMQGKDWRIPL